jgi:acyl dehydratase
MMEARTLQSAPSILPLYARAAAPLIPGASLLPGVPGRGKEIPDLEIELPGVRAQPAEVAAYARVCGFSLRDQLPATYPHVLAFPLHMAVMASGDFPFGAIGLVHIENRIEQHRPIAIGEQLTIRVRPTPLQPHKRGRTFSLVTEVKAGDETVWTSTSTMLRRGGDTATQAQATQAPSDANHGSGEVAPNDDARGGGAASAVWRLEGDLGRRYAAVSGDRNPIHMHSLTAKPLGFPQAIAHGMWTKARCLAALESRLPDAFGAEVRFRKPILLPSKVEFASEESGEQIDFAVRDAKRGTPHLDGHVAPLTDQPEEARRK